MSSILLQAQLQAVIGIIMLEAQYPRPPGELGHDDFFSVALHYQTLKGVWPAKVISSAVGMRQARLVPAFQSIVRDLERRGVKAITTSCGFLVLLQKELQSVVKIPVVTSSLLQLPALLKTQPQVGVLTMSAKYLSAEHLRAAGVAKDRLSDVLIQGMESSAALMRYATSQQPQIDRAQAEQDVLAAALKLKARAPQLQTVVLEPTAMTAYQAAIEAATGWQILSLRSDQRLQRVIDATFTLSSQPAVEENQMQGTSA